MALREKKEKVEKAKLFEALHHFCFYQLLTLRPLRSLLRATSDRGPASLESPSLSLSTPPLVCLGNSRKKCSSGTEYRTQKASTLNRASIEQPRKIQSSLYRISTVLTLEPISINGEVTGCTQKVREHGVTWKESIIEHHVRPCRSAQARNRRCVFLAS